MFSPEKSTVNTQVLAPTLCSVTERLVNKALALNTGDTRAIYALNQKTLTLVLAELNFPLCITVHEQKVIVTTLSTMSNCTIITSIPTLIALKNEEQLTALIKNEQLDIEGDIKVAQQFSKVAESLHIDWQTELAKHIGDIATYKLVNAGIEIANKLKFAKTQIESDLSEWVVHEKKLAVTQADIQQFCHGVDAVKQQTNTLSEKISRITEQLSAINTSPTDKGA